MFYVPAPLASILDGVVVSGLAVITDSPEISGR